MSITVYSMEKCPQCKNTYSFLDKQGAKYEVVDIKSDPRAADVLDRYNFQAAPVVVVEGENGEDAWCGFRPDKIAAAVKEYALA